MRQSPVQLVEVLCERSAERRKQYFPVCVPLAEFRRTVQSDDGLSGAGCPPNASLPSVVVALDQRLLIRVEEQLPFFKVKRTGRSLFPCEPERSRRVCLLIAVPPSWRKTIH